MAEHLASSRPVSASFCAEVSEQYLPRFAGPPRGAQGEGLVQKRSLSQEDRMQKMQANGVLMTSFWFVVLV